MKTTLIIYMLLLLISSGISGCIEASEPYSPIKYSITIGPKNGENYHQTLDFKSDELQALYNTAFKGGI